MNTIIDKDLLSIQEARILAENASEARKKLEEFSQDKLDSIVERMASEIEKHVESLAKMSADETYYGVWQDKLLKNRFVCSYVRKQLRGMKCVGIIKEDTSKQIMDIGVPMGVIASVIPATNPVSTTIYNTLIAIKSGNAIIFSPHPRALKTTARALDILIETAEAAGLPECAISYLHTVTKSGTKELISHESVNLIMITGVPKIMKLAAYTGKPVLYGSAGNGPAFIEKTADITKAVSDIISSKIFDNGVGAASEQSIVVDAAVESAVKAEFISRGAYFMTEKEADTLGKMLFLSDGSTDPEFVGKSAEYLAKRAGIKVPEGTVVLVSHQDYVSGKNPYSKERLCPVLAYYIENDWQDACEKCIELLITERRAHTLVIHSRDKNVIRQFALKKPVARVLVNTPAAFGGMGMTTNLFPALTLGSGISGEGFTSDNVSPMNLVYIRKVGYGVRDVQDIFPDGTNINLNDSTVETKLDSVQLEQLRSLIEQVLSVNKK